MFIIHNIFTKHILFHIFTLFKDCSILHSLPIFHRDRSQIVLKQKQWRLTKQNERFFFSFRRHQCCVADSCVFLREIRIQHTAALFMTVVNNSWERPSINMCQRRLICCALQTKMENIVVTMTNLFPHYPPGWHSTIKPISVQVLQEECSGCLRLFKASESESIQQFERVARAVWRTRAGIHSPNDRLWGTVV